MQVTSMAGNSFKRNPYQSYLDTELFTNSSSEQLSLGDKRQNFAKRSACINRLSSENGSGDDVFTDYDNPSYIDGLLFEIYDRWSNSHRDSYDSDTFTECSSTSEFVSRSGGHQEEWEKRYAGQLRRAFLETKSTDQLSLMAKELRHSIAVMSARIVRQLKHRDRRLTKLNHHNDVITAVLQASSLKRRIDTRMRFSIEPSSGGESAFHQWRDAMKAVARLPSGIPNEFRKTVWLNLADQYMTSIQVDWERTLKFVFNERSNPDDHTLGVQIVKDLHRTGCGGFSGLDNEEDRAILKRVLLAYARWNKTVGYCQGFNVIAALLLNVMDRREDHALKVMIYLIDYVIPSGYFANNLRALSVDMAVFRDLLRLKYPKLSRHLDYLQHNSDGKHAGPNYEPPLTNVFTMQWFLTLFATCLPKYIVLRIWDCVLLEGSEMLLRSALLIWSQLSSHIMSVESADEFYTVMGYLCQDLMEGRMCNADDMVKCMYDLGSFPLPHLDELREKYTYNITPFSPTVNPPHTNKKSSRHPSGTLSDDDDIDDEDIQAINSYNGPGYQGDISAVGPGAYGAGLDQISVSRPLYLERMTTDISALKKQYGRLKHRQAQAHIILASVSARQNSVVQSTIAPKIESPIAMNHLFINKDKIKSRNRYVTTSPFIASEYPKISDLTVPFNDSPNHQAGNSLTTETIQGFSECEFRDRTGSVSEMSEYSGTSVVSDETRRDDNHSPVSDTCDNMFSDNGDSAIMKECEPLEKLMIIDSEKFSVDEREIENSPCISEDLNRNELSIRQELENEENNLDVDNKSNELQNCNNCTSAEISQTNISENCDASVCTTENCSNTTTETSSDSLDNSTKSGNSPDTFETIEIESVAVIEQTNINRTQLNGELENAVKFQRSSSHESHLVKSVSTPQSLSDHRRLNEARNVENTAIFLYQTHKRRQTQTQYHSSSIPETLPESPTKSRPHNPFPIRHVNSHRAVNGLKLGLYTPEVLQAYSKVPGFKGKVPLSKTKKFFSVS